MDYLLIAAAVVGVLLGWFGATTKSTRVKEKEQRKRSNALIKAKEVREDVQTLDDDRIVSEFERLYRSKRR